MIKPKNPLPNPLVYIIWDDACSNTGWFSKNELEEWCAKTFALCHQVGWLIEETKKHYIIASLYSPKSGPSGQETWGHLQRIPKTWAKIYTFLPPKKSA